MKMRLIYPGWPKLKQQTEFHLPPHGPVVFAATVPTEVDLKFTDDNLEEIDFNEKTDLVALSVMLTCQLPTRFCNRRPLSCAKNTSSLWWNCDDAPCRRGQRTR